MSDVALPSCCRSCRNFTAGQPSKCDVLARAIDTPMEIRPEWCPLLVHPLVALPGVDPERLHSWGCGDGELVIIDYTNWRGKRSCRLIRPIKIWLGTTDFHTSHQQWFLLAEDLVKKEHRSFAMEDIHRWLNCGVPLSAAPNKSETEE